MDKSKDVVSNKIKTATLRCGKRTYFFDLSRASNKRKYLRITESRFVEEGKDHERNSLVLFPEDVAGFQASFGEIVVGLN